MEFKSLSSLVLFLLFFNLANAQDKNTKAQVTYTKAEEYYSQREYEKALLQLEETEKLLGETNSKILYLKIHVLNDQFSTSNSNYNKLMTSFDRFFSVTKKETYPEEKYKEIVRMQTDVEDFKRIDSIKYKEISKSENIQTISKYLDETPNSFYYNELSAQKTSLQKIQDEKNAVAQKEQQEQQAKLEKEKQEQQAKLAKEQQEQSAKDQKLREKQEVESQLAKVNTDLKSAQKVATKKRIWGGVFLAVGGGMVLYGVQQSGGDLTSVDFSDTQSIVSPAAVLVGGIFSIIGITKLIKGNNKAVKPLKTEQDRLLAQQKRLSYNIAPMFQRKYGYDIAGVKLRINF